jgi:hypothetical protein
MKIKPQSAAPAVETLSAVPVAAALVLLLAPFELYAAGSVLRMVAADADVLLADPGAAQIATQAQADMAAPSFFFDLVPPPPVADVEEAGASEVSLEPAAPDAAPNDAAPNSKPSES